MRNFHSFLRCFGVSETRLSNKTKSPARRVKVKSALPEELCRQFSLGEIKAATNNFDRNFVIGRGGSGDVYKGFFDNGALVLPVKRISPESSMQKGLDQDFRNEVLLLCQLRHRNLISLVGFCDDADEMILVFNYMSNGTLYHNLHGTAHAPPLTWKQRLQICIGAAHGLHYLHIGAKRAVIHRDIKTINILLDDEFVPKISDFGLSKIGPFSFSNAPLTIELPPAEAANYTTRLVGTMGYLDPDIFSNVSLVTDKSDIYAFGVVLFEVLCGRKVIFNTVHQERQHLITWVTESMRNGTIYNTIDPFLKGKISPTCLEKFLEIAFSCVQVPGRTRPTLGEVEATLELVLELQNKANSEMKITDPHGEGLYEEVVFSASAFSLSNGNMYERHGSSNVEHSSNAEHTFSDIEEMQKGRFNLSDSLEII